MALIEIREKPTAGHTIRLHESDNVVVARTDLGIGTKLEPEGLLCKSQVTAGFKVASRPIAKGEPIRKYNVVI